MSDADLQRGIEAARGRTREWLAGMQALGCPRGVTRSSAEHDAAAWPQMLLPGTYNAVMNLALIGGLDEFTPAERAALARWITSFRRPDGVFHMPGMTDATVFKKPDRTETWTYIDFHVTNYSLGALEVLDGLDRPVLDFAGPWLDPQFLEAWLARRDLRDPWQEGNNIVNLSSFLLLMDPGFWGGGCRLELPSEVARALDLLIAWHLRLVEPATGFWGVGQHADPVRLLHAMAGATHNYHLFYARGVPVPHVERAVDYCLSLPPEVVSACIDVDIIDILAHAHRLTGHRRPDIEAWMRTMLPRLLDFQDPDGGFPDTREGWRTFDGWPGGYRERQGISNTFATWFRWIAIAMIAETLWPGWRSWRFRRMVGIGYFKG